MACDVNLFQLVHVLVATGRVRRSLANGGKRDSRAFGKYQLVSVGSHVPRDGTILHWFHTFSARTHGSVW